MNPIKSDAHHPFAVRYKTDSLLCYEEFHKIRFTARSAPTSRKTGWLLERYTWETIYTLQKRPPPFFFFSLSLSLSLSLSECLSLTLSLYRNAQRRKERRSCVMNGTTDFGAKRIY